MKLIIMISLLWVVNAQAAMYKWKDADGVWHYTQQPPPSGDAKKIKPPPPPPSTVAQEKKALDDQLEKSSEQNKKDYKDKKKAEILAQQAQQKKKNCEAAKNNVKILAQSAGRHLFKNEKGEVEFYDDNEIQKKKTEAQQQVDKFCK